MLDRLLLEQAIQIISERGKSYGSAQSLFENAAKRWSLTLGMNVSPCQVVMCMIDLKLARLNNNPNHNDSIVDVAGYAAILNAVINSKGKERD